MLSHLAKDGAKYVRNTHFSGQRPKLCRSAFLVLLIMLVVGDAANCTIRGFRDSGADEVVEVKGNGSIRDSLVPVGTLTRLIWKVIK